MTIHCEQIERGRGRKDLGFILGSSAREGRHQVGHDFGHWASAGKAFLQLLGEEGGLIRQGGVGDPELYEQLSQQLNELLSFRK